MLIPVAGGPHSKDALKLIDQSMGGSECEIVPFLVEEDIKDVSRAVGQMRLESIIGDARLSKQANIQPKVALGSNFIDIIGEEAADGYDLVILGSSDAGFIKRALFGTLPDRLLNHEEGCAVGVIRKAKPLWSQLKHNLESWLDLRIPQLSREDRVALNKNLETNSRWNFDFMVLMGLSTAIASFGLIQDSAAVVIGAMLVAPLMSPLLGAGLSLVQGNQPLILRSSEAIIWGLAGSLKSHT